MTKLPRNPYMPAADHPPPYLAGREHERKSFRRLLAQDVILENVILTGVRGIGKTSLLREFYKTDAIDGGWLWVESNVSENLAANEEKLLVRICADLGVIAGDWIVDRDEMRQIGFHAGSDVREVRADASFWRRVLDEEEGLNLDKLKKILSLAWRLMRLYAPQKRGIVFAYDEAQNFGNNAAREQYPLSLLLDAFSSLQGQKIPFMLALTGLPPLHGKLVDARTFAERMFRVVMLRHLGREAAFDAILKPLPPEEQAVRNYFDERKDILYEATAGYPYFIQYWCQQLYDYIRSPESSSGIVGRIRARLDEDFYAGRWARLSDRQRDLLLAASRATADGEKEFTVQEVARHSSVSAKPFSTSHVNQMLSALAEKGMVFKNRHGKYSFAVPMLDDYIRRRHSPASDE